MSAPSRGFAERYLAFLQKRYLWVLLIGLLATALGAWSASRFTLKTDFASLLPQDEPSIRDVNRAKKRMGGLSNMIVAVEGDDPAANKRLIDDLAARFEKLPEEYVTYLKYHTNIERDFYSKHKHLYVSLEDLEQIHQRLKAKIRYERIKNNPVLSMDFDGEELEPVEFDISDIRKKYDKKTEKYDRYIDGYLNTEQGKLWTIMVYPPGLATGVAFGKRLRGVIQTATAEVCNGGPLPDSADPLAVIDSKCKDKYGPTIKVGFTGRIITAIVEQKAIIDDLLLVTSICLTLVMLVVLLYFRQLRALPTIGLPLIMGTTWTFGISIFIVGHLNTSTAFLAAIIVGNGINFGLIQLARYVEERRSGKDLSEALCAALKYTAKATVIAALAASIAYGSLIITSFRGFNGFGYMGGLGMILCWLSAFTIQPALLLLLERFRPAKFTAKPKKVDGLLFKPYSRLVTRFGQPIHALGWIFAIVCIMVTIPYLKDPFEYDFRNLRNQREGVQANELRSRVGKTFTKRMNPMFILADRSDQVPMIMHELRRNNSVGPNKEMFHEVRSIHNYLPSDQKKKVRVIKKIRRQLSKATLSWLSEEDRAELDKHIPTGEVRPVSVDDLPLAMSRMFTEKNGRIGLPIALYPRHGRTTWDGHFLIELSDASRTIRLPDGEIVTSAGSPTIFADMIKAIERDGPLAVLASLLGVILLVIIAFRSVKYILVTLAVLFFGVVWTVGPMAMIDMKLNFLNFIALPITFGIGIDYAVNVLSRYRIEGPGSMQKVISTTGGAVALCSLTTLIGYSSLLIADSNALVSFGLLADIGEVASLTAAILLLPALIMLIEFFKNRRRGSKEGNSDN
jgi:predicted RND superfamily exporter protein